MKLEQIDIKGVIPQNDVTIYYQGQITFKEQIDISKEKHVEIKGTNDGILYYRDEPLTKELLKSFIDREIHDENQNLKRGNMPKIEKIIVDGNEIYNSNLNKGKWLEKMEEGAIALDTETTGFNKDDEVLQLSIIDSKGKVLFNQYFKPKVKTSWESAMAVNHITPESLSDKKHIDHYKKEIEEILKKSKKIVGYNLGFDMTMLAQNGIKLPEAEKYIDLMIPFSKVYGVRKSDGGYKWQKLITCAEKYGYEGDGWHDSLADTKATMHCYKEMIKKGDIYERDIFKVKDLANYKEPSRKGIRHISSDSKSLSR